MKKKSETKSIFTLILIAFLIVVIPVYVAGFGAYHWTISRLQKEITISQESQTEYYMDKLQSSILRIIKQESALLNDKDVMNLSVFPEYNTNIDTTFAINRIQARLAALVDISDIIENATIHIPGLERSIYAKGSISKLTMEQYRDIVDLSLLSSNHIVFYDEMFFSVVTSYQTFNKDNSLPACLIAVEISPDNIRNTLRQMKGLSDGGMVLLEEESREVVSSYGDLTVADNLLPSGEIVDKGSKTEVKACGGMNYLVTSYKDEYTGLTLIHYTSTNEIYQSLQHYKPYFWVFTVCAAIVASFFIYFIFRQVKLPLSKLIGAFQEVEAGSLDITIEYSRDNEFRYLFEAFNSMIERIGNLIDQVYKQEILYQKSELKQLQSQINPHFLYNSYFVLNDMVVNQDYENLEDFTKHMGIYFQYITRNSSMTSMLIEEVQHAQIYANFQAHRFRNRITMFFEELPTELNGSAVPKMILQPVIENAFEHGLKNKLKDGILKVYFVAGSGSLDIVVEDNGDELSDEELGLLQERLLFKNADVENTALISIDKRLELKHGAGSGVQVSRSELGGLKVILHMEKVIDEAIGGI